MTDTLTDKAPPPEPPERGDRGERASNPLGVAALVALIAVIGLGGGWPMLVIVGAIVVMIFLHELGHYLTAKWAGMKVTEFFIGFGPRLWSFRRGETEYGVKAIPAGAYVRIIGMNNLDEYDPADAERTYLSKPYWRRMSVAVAGSTMHFLMALACIFVLLAAVGVPGGSVGLTRDEASARIDTGGWVIGTVEDGSAADRLGVEEGDRIISVDGVGITGFDDFGDVVQARPAEQVEVVYEHDGSTVTDTVALGARRDPDTGEREGFFGVSPTLPSETVGAFSAIGRSFTSFGDVVVESVGAIGRFFSPSGLADWGDRLVNANEEAGPTVDEGPATPGGAAGREASPSDDDRIVSIYGAARIGADLTEDGLGGFLMFLVVLNIFIGVFNLVPLLPLDGGHVAIATYEKIRSLLQGGRRYQADVSKLLPVTYAVVMLLVFLGLSGLYLDIADPVDLGG